MDHTGADIPSPTERRALLEAEVAKLTAQGYQPESRVDHHVVMVRTKGPQSRVEIFVDVAGVLHWS